MTNDIDRALENIQGSKNKKTQTKTMLAVKSIVSLVVVLTLIMTFVVRSYVIPSGSMEKTLLIGDMLLGNKFIYGFRTPNWIGIPFTTIGFKIPWVKLPAFKDVKRGDILIFQPPISEDNYVKRCVGIPGDTIMIINKVLYVNGKNFEEFYQSTEEDPANPEMRAKSQIVDPNYYPEGAIERGIYNDQGNRDNFGPVVVPKDHYFMMGDNRDNSLDSRYWGFLNKDYIIGKPIVVYFSYSSKDEYGDYIPNLLNRIRWQRIGYFIQ